MNQVIESVVSKVVEVCCKDETRSKLEDKVLAPAVAYVADRFSWGVRVFQVVAVLVLIQTVLLLWLILRDLRR
jgi:hypothetical protein